MYETIVFEADQGVARITLNRPQRLNAFNGTMHAELRDALARAAADKSVRALLLGAAGRGFCAGQDLSDQAAIGADALPDLGDPLERDYNPLVLALRRLPQPVVCAVNGVAAGAGANIALACDIVVASRSASFVQAFSRIGLLPDSGGTYVLPRLVGTARAMAITMLGHKVTAEQAATWGMIWRCVDDEELEAEAVGLARLLAESPTLALARTKQAILASFGNSLEAQLDIERDFQRELGRTADYREGVAAFIEKRTPRFRGE